MLKSASAMEALFYRNKSKARHKAGPYPSSGQSSYKSCIAALAAEERTFFALKDKKCMYSTKFC